MKLIGLAAFGYILFHLVKSRVEYNACRKAQKLKREHYNRYAKRLKQF